MAEKRGEDEGAAPLQGAAISLANIFLLHQYGRPYRFGPGRQYPLLRHWEKNNNAFKAYYHGFTGLQFSEY